MQKFEFLKETNELLIQYPLNEIEDPNDLIDGYYNALMDWLGDFDFVSAGELGDGKCVFEGIVCELDINQLAKLERGEVIYVSLGVTLEEWVKEHPEDMDFYNWYY